MSKGRTVSNLKLEETLKEWFEEMRAEDIAITTDLIILQACELKKGFKNGKRSKMV